PHAWPPKSARRVQPDGACLQSAPGAQRPWRGKADGGRGGVKRTSNRARPRAKTSSARSWRLRRSRSGFWRKMTKYSMNLHQIYRVWASGIAIQAALCDATFFPLHDRKNPPNATFNVYRASDDNWFLIVTEPDKWPALAAGIGRPD